MNKDEHCKIAAAELALKLSRAIGMIKEECDHATSRNFFSQMNSLRKHVEDVYCEIWPEKFGRTHLRKTLDRVVMNVTSGKSYLDGYFSEICKKIHALMPGYGFLEEI